MSNIPTCGLCDGVRVCKDDSDKPLTLRERAAIAALHVAAQKLNFKDPSECFSERVMQKAAKFAVMQADALVKELSK